jgi:molecular chaperone GrpE
MPDHRDSRGRTPGHYGQPGHVAHDHPTRPAAGHNGGPAGTPGQPHRTRAQERIDEIDVSPSRLVAQIEALTGELVAANAKSEEYLAGLQRERAEFSNYRRRTSEEREQMLGLAGEDLIRKVLAIADDFDLAIDNQPADLAGNGWVEGVAAIDRKLRALLESEGVSPIDAAAGTPFDPREHEAIANVPGTGLAEGAIVDVVRRGYRLRDRVIRPALVAVASGEPSTTGAASDAAPTN